MTPKYYNTQTAADMLGITPAEVNRMRERRELSGYRDGADWKFKAEDVEALVRRKNQGGGGEPAGGDDVLLSEVTLGESDAGTSGTVIGMEGSTGDSDIRLADDDGIMAPDAAGGSMDELDLTLEDSGLMIGDEPGSSGSRSALEDDDLVLGGSGSGSDITIGGDSGISLVDPADSGLSLEDPLEFATDAATEETLELGPADMLEEPARGGSGEFLLQPNVDESTEGEESDSGSQEIALDLEAEGDEEATMIGGGPAAPAALEADDFGAAAPAGFGAPLEAEPMFAAAAGPGPVVQPAVEGGPAVAAAPEVPYSGLNVLSLALCALLLAFCGMFMYDLLRNMWSWGGEYPVNSSMMDFLVGLIEK